MKLDGSVLWIISNKSLITHDANWVKTYSNSVFQSNATQGEVEKFSDSPAKRAYQIRDIHVEENKRLSHLLLVNYQHFLKYLKKYS